MGKIYWTKTLTYMVRWLHSSANSEGMLYFRDSLDVMDVCWNESWKIKPISCIQAEFSVVHSMCLTATFHYTWSSQFSIICLVPTIPLHYYIHVPKRQNPSCYKSIINSGTRLPILFFKHTFTIAIRFGILWLMISLTLISYIPYR